MESQIKNAALLRVLAGWRAASGMKAVPSFMAFNAVVRENAASSFLARVESNGFRYVTVGDRLAERLGRPLAGEIVSSETLEMVGSLEASYRYCVENRTPCYEFLRYDFGEGQPTLFERLTMPFIDGRASVSHIGGTVSFSGLANRDRGRDG